MLRWLGTLGILASCGRLSFAPSDAERRDGVVDGSPERPNIVFLSAASQPGGFGGIAAADTICNGEAAASGMSGKFIAFLSDSTTNARDRFAGSRGWTLPDGTPIGDTIDSMLDNDRVLNAIDMLANGTRVPTGSTWTGSTLTGLADTRHCSDWTDSTAASNGQGQSVRSAQFAGGGSTMCSTNRRFICFEIGYAHDVPITPVSGRYAFLTLAKRTTPIDVPGGDSLCNAEAAAAGLPGTYLVALATTTTAIASRFTIDARPWVRVDGTQVAAPAEMFVGPGPLQSFINQHADGTYHSLTFWTGVPMTADMVGTATETCVDWTSVSSADNAPTGQSHQTTRNAFWSGSTGNCGNGFAMLCMQQ